MKKQKSREHDKNIIKSAMKTTPSQRLDWLRKAKEFSLNTIPKSTLRLIIKLREKENI
jgi:hypothetical protein